MGVARCRGAEAWSSRFPLARALALALTPAPAPAPASAPVLRWPLPGQSRCPRERGIGVSQPTCFLRGHRGQSADLFLFPRPPGNQDAYQFRFLAARHAPCSELPGTACRLPVSRRAAWRVALPSLPLGRALTRQPPCRARSVIGLYSGGDRERVDGRYQRYHIPGRTSRRHQRATRWLN
jgi:hypothetical protein